ncbi:MAG: MFS transporter [Gemmataceae bacterium]
MSTTIAPPPDTAAPATWAPEDALFWERHGKRLAWRTLTITTFDLLLAFATWFMVSALVVRLEGVGFRYSTAQLFWLTAMPGLAGGTFRIIHMFLVPIFGTRATVTWATLSLVIPCVGWGLAVQDPATPFAVLLLLAFLAGLGGGNFSSFMPSTSLFFPKRLQGTALGIQAGIGNLGVSVTQFLVPWIISAAALGSLVGTPQTFVKAGQTSEIYLQNAAYIWIPFVLFGTAAAWCLLKSVPVRASFLQQTDIFRQKHTWVMTSLYIMTFGSFSGFAAIFPLLIKKIYGDFENAPDPLTYAFLGPLVGSVARILFGPVSDRFGGGRVTQISGVGMLACAIGVTFFTEPASLSAFPGFLACMLGLFFFSGIGNASTFKQIPAIFPARQAGGVIGWTAAVAAYGPFLFSVFIGLILAVTGAPTWFFYAVALFYIANVGLNWWYYVRPGAERPC